MKRKNYLSLVFGLFILFHSQVVLSQENKQNPPQTEQRQCNSFIEGLKFCLDSPFISVNSGEALILRYSIKNLTEKQIIIPGGRRGGSEILHFSITDENGNKIPSILERLTEKLNNAEESKKFVIVTRGSGRRSSYFEPNEETKWNWNLSYLYDFKNKGKYFVEIYKKEHKQDETTYPKTLLGKVEIEIK